MRTTSPNRCPYCGKSLAMALPGYMRVEKCEDGVWRPSSGICRCDPEIYKFCVLDLCKKKNLGKSRLFFKEDIKGATLARERVPD